MAVIGLSGVWSEWCDWLESQHRNPQEWLPIPLHPQHLEHWILGHFAKEIDEGILLPFGPEIETAPSMSFRTMLPTAPALPFIKLPVAIWMTSEMRSLGLNPFTWGRVLSTIIEDITDVEQGFDGKLDFSGKMPHGTFVIKIVWMTLRVSFSPSCFVVRMRGQETIIHWLSRLHRYLPRSRINPILISELIALSGDTPETWFRHYTRIILKPVLAMYLIYGVALEAHQQNTQVLFDDSGRAVAMLIRDFGDGRSWAPALRKQGYELKPYIWHGILPTVFEDDIEPVRTFVVDACLVSHLHEIALCLTHFYCIPDNRMWKVIGEELDRVFKELHPRLDASFWHQEREHFMNYPRIPAH